MPNIPCTNPNYGDDDISSSDSWWWTEHTKCPSEYRCVCLYPAHPDGLVGIDNGEELDFVMPDLGAVDIGRLPKEAYERISFLISRYGADNIVSLAMGEFAEAYGYKPVQEAKQALSLEFRREALIEQFTNNPERAMQLYGHLLESVGYGGEDKPAKTTDFDIKPQ